MTTVDPQTQVSSPATTTLSQAIAAFRAARNPASASPINRPTAQEMVQALLTAESNAKHQHLTFPFEGLQGNWQLCFTAPRSAHWKKGVAVGKGWYMPGLIPAQISFWPKPTSEGPAVTGEIGNQLQLGPLLIRLKGPARYSGQKNLLAFDFTHLHLSLFGRLLYDGAFRSGKRRDQPFDQQPISQLPFFAFFLIGEDCIAARGRGGGLALWVKEK